MYLIFKRSRKLNRRSYSQCTMVTLRNYSLNLTLVVLVLLQCVASKGRSVPDSVIGQPLEETEEKRDVSPEDDQHIAKQRQSSFVPQDLIVNITTQAFGRVRVLVDVEL